MLLGSGCSQPDGRPKGKNHHTAERENMKKEGDHLVDDCPCTQLACPIHGNCIQCVRDHREHKRHLPECMQEVLREQVAALAKQVEFGVVEQRPTPEYWAQRAKRSESG